MGRELPLLREDQDWTCDGGDCEMVVAHDGGLEWRMVAHDECKEEDEGLKWRMEGEQLGLKCECEE